MPDNIFRSSEQEFFSAIIGKHLKNPDAPLLLEGGVGIGKTRAYLAAIAASSLRVAIVLPTHQLMDQFMASADLSAINLPISVFRPSNKFETEKEYLEQKIAAQDARVMLCTAASVIIDQRLGGDYNDATNRDVILFDEADQLPDMAALQSDFTIDSDLMNGQPIKDALKRISKSRSMLVGAEQKAAARVMLEILDEPVGYAEVGMGEGGCAVLHHRLPGRLLKKISNRASTVFLSATLTHNAKFDNFKHVLGIESISSLSREVEPDRHGSLDFVVKPHTADTDEWFAATVNSIKNAKRPTLVITTSHNITERLIAAVGEQPDLLIRAASWAGLDTPTRWRSVIIPRIPFGNPAVIDGKKVNAYMDSHVMANRRLRQAIGRGLRTPDAVCTVIIMDSRIDKFPRFVPDRFITDWNNRKVLDAKIQDDVLYEEGDRHLAIEVKIKRESRIRDAMFRHHGEKCQHRSGCQITQLHLLDVHHVTPVSAGVLTRNKDDYMVLCKNHHADVHKEMRDAYLSPS